jgi:NADH:ubiquinone oxidoreductase subunit H
MPVIALSGTTNLTGIVLSQDKMFNCWPFFPSLILFLICILARLIDYLSIYQNQSQN